MYRSILGIVAAGAIMISGAPAQAFDCGNSFAGAQGAIDQATAAMKAMPDGEKKGLVHTLLDDAKTLLQSAKHNHEKPAAGAYDHARSVAKARSAKGYAEAAQILAGG